MEKSDVCRQGKKEAARANNMNEKGSDAERGVGCERFDGRSK